MASYIDLFTEFVRLEIEVWNSLDADLQGSAGITLAQFQALSAIRKNAGSARVQDISTELMITVGATSKLVDRLERDGFAARSANPDDRRSSVINLSARGERALKAADHAAEQHLRTVFGNAIPAERVARMIDELASLRTHSSAAMTA
jgi:DNA-binding MarR family transcriptional regulator